MVFYSDSFSRWRDVRSPDGGCVQGLGEKDDGGEVQCVVLPKAIAKGGYDSRDTH